MAWNTFSNVLTRSSGVLVNNAALVSKIYFPRLVLPISTVMTTAFDFCVVLILSFVLLIWFWHLPGWNVLLMPVCVIIISAVALGVGLITAALAVSYRDALYMLPVATQFLMWGSAVFYPADRLPLRYQHLLQLNPLVSPIEAFRWSMLGVGDVSWIHFGYATLFAAVTLVIGVFAFRRMERRFADVI